MMIDGVHNVIANYIRGNSSGAVIITIAWKRIVIIKNGRIKMIQTKYVRGDTMPYRFDMDSLHGTGISPDEAVMAALSAGKEIPAGLRNAKEAAKHIFQKHQPADWIEVIRILIEDSF